MPVADSDLQTAIINELSLNAVDYPARATALNAITVLWLMYQGKALLANGPLLRYWYVKRACLDILLSGFAVLPDFDADVQSKDSQMFAMYGVMRKNATAEIERIEAESKGLRLPVSGAMTQVVPVLPTPGLPDPGDSVYRGDALKSSLPATRP